MYLLVSYDTASKEKQVQYKGSECLQYLQRGNKLINLFNIPRNKKGFGIQL